MDSQGTRVYAKISGALTSQVILAYLGYLFGTWVDERFDIAPWGLLLGLVAGLGLGLAALIRLILPPSDSKTDEPS